MRRTALICLALALPGCGTTTEAGRFDRAPATVADGHVLLGIGDQNTEMFTDPRFVALGVRYTRLAMPWDAVFTEPDRLDAWLRAARAAGQTPLVAFNRARGSECPADPCAAPTRGEFARAAREFVRRYPWVHDLQPWNEANSSTQPTAKRPALAAAYYRELKAACPRCAITAADVLPDDAWLKSFLDALGGERPRLWGLHNYPDVNRFSEEGTRAFLKSVPGEVWVTETGPIDSFSTGDGRTIFEPDPARGARATAQAVRLAALDPRITRLYLYQWRRTNPQDRFDSGLTEPGGATRPALTRLRELLLEDRQ